MDTLRSLYNIGLPVGVIIVALIAIGLILTRLYRRASKEIAFVRTGLKGQKVVVNGGCLVFPVLHEIIPVNMNTVKLEVSRTQREALITRDRMRVDVMAAFYLRVQSTEESIAAAAQTLGRRTLDPDALKTLVEGKFIDGLRAAAAEMDMEALHEKRSEFGRAVLTAVTEDLLKNGLELEAVSMTALDQTRKEYFDEENAFDAAGLTKLTEEIEDKRRRRNEIERETAVHIARKDLESEQQTLSIKREGEYARMQQERELAIRKAEQDALIATEEAQNARNANEARIVAEQETAQARITAERQVEEAGIERGKAIRLAEQDREIAVAERSKQESAAKAAADIARTTAVKAEEQVTTARQLEEAERTKTIEIVRARQEAEHEAIGIKVRAETERMAAEDDAHAMRTRAEAKALEITIEAQARAEAETVTAEATKVRLAIEAEGMRAQNEAENTLNAQMAKLRERLAIIDRMEGIVRESVKPMEKIEGIKIVQLGALADPRAISAQGGSTTHAGGPAESLVQAALAYRMQAPMVDEMLREMGLGAPGELLSAHAKADPEAKPAETATHDAGAEGAGAQA